MKKNYCLINLFIATIFTLSGCNQNNKNSESSFSDSTIDDNKISDSIVEVKENLYDDIILESNEKLPNENNPKDVIYYCLWKLKHVNSFKKESRNEVISKVLFANYKQETKETLLKNNDKFYNYVNTSSTFVKLIHQAFYYNGKVIYQNDSNDYIVESSDKYDDIYGFSPNKLLSGQVFNDDSIIETSFEGYDDNKYTLKIILDKDYANVLIKKRMKEFGSLNNLPEFIENTTFTLVIDNNYLPITYNYVSKYKVEMPILGKITCIENNKAKYSSFNENVDIEQENFFISKINNKNN